MHPNTAAAVATFAAATPSEAGALCRVLFPALWFEDRDIGKPSVFGELGGSPDAAGGGDRLSRWHEEWQRFDRRVASPCWCCRTARCPGAWER